MSVGSCVSLNVYDLDNLASSINKYARNWSTGAFHAGVEVYGEEFAFGATHDPSWPGIVRCVPKEHPMHVYRETVNMGMTSLTCDQVAFLVDNVLQAEWPGTSYHLLRKNCINFADQFCCLLGVGSVPLWIKNLQLTASRAAEKIENTAIQMQQLDEKIGFTDGLAMIKNVPSEIGKAAQNSWQAVTGGLSWAFASEEENGYTVR
eukprot:CAMPEP_0113848134 /NCGR_PEP_ID=MMETSP0372-20130328/2288_1 /TAXON_ID=340204 /ORGANISM="Lankesteria abbotti" /LENGTH=204 /DNA_ID=CAMNT_0000817543 /DNA_START=106 /DNA_END=720 /DNA_ORIENTATION=- /assembly_acc=CAM_ASM_000359